MRSCRAAVFESREDVSRPPRVAKRRALSLAISASSPRRTNDVFSLTPASFAALFSNHRC